MSQYSAFYATVKGGESAGIRGTVNRKDDIGRTLKAQLVAPPVGGVDNWSLDTFATAAMSGIKTAVQGKDRGVTLGLANPSVTGAAARSAILSLGDVESGATVKPNRKTETEPAAQ